MPRPEKWTLADVLDFEALVAADERSADPAAVAARDARLWQEQIAPNLTAEEATDRRVVFHRWLNARRTGELLPGKWLNTTWNCLTGGALLGGLVFGFAVASTALYYAGERPVNVAVFVGVTVGVQWILLLWSLLVILFRGVRAASQQLLVRLGESIGQMLANAAEHLSGEQRLRLRAEAVSLRQLAGRNLRLLCWPPLLALQLFGIWWNCGVFFALLMRVLFTDVAFGWESTVAQSPHGMSALVHALATPWTWYFPGACPTLEQVEQSWFHYQSGVGALDRGATASWWPWLVGIILVYGLLPRAALRFYFSVQSNRDLRQVSFDEPRHRAAWYRLTGPVIHSNRPPQEGASSHGAPGGSPARARAEAGCLLIDSSLAGARTEIEQWVTAQFGWRLACREVVEIDYPSGNDDALTRLAAALPKAPCWLIAVPAPFTAFSAFTQFIERIGPGAGFVLIVALDEHGKPKAPDPEWTRYWSDFLRAEASDCVPFSYTP
ncbi:MAG: DUF2868 domain-containing protein [Chthoniobacter sp.]|nr:DUF2868 domain-containing protein [Chthoniobacter sp.]